MESLYYEFELSLHRLYLEIDSPCSVQIWWKRSKHKAMSRHYRIAEKVQYIDLNEGLKTSVKCKFEAGKPIPFTTSIIVLLYPATNVNSCKQGGLIQSLDLTQILIPDNKKAAVSKRFELKLQKSPPNSRILFTLSSKFLREGGNQESQNDISFQGSSQSMFNRSQIDMTFRPPVNPQANRKTSRNKQIIPLLRPNQIEQKIQSPLQRVDYLKIEGVHRPEENQFIKNDKPLGFSFGPVGNPERQRQNRVLLDEVNDLREELNNQKRQNERLLSQIRARQSQRNSGVDDKKLLLLNQLNAAVNQCDQLKRQKEDMVSQLNKLKEDYRKLRDDIKEKELLYGKAKDQNRQLAFNFNKLRDQLSDCNQLYEAKKKEYEQIRPKLDKFQRQNQQMRNELFRKQSQLINNQNQLQSVKMQYMNVNKNIPIMQQLKRVNQDLGKQRAELEKSNNQKMIALERQQNLREELTKKLMLAKQEFEAMKNKFIESYKHQESQFQQQLRQIQQEMHHIMMERQTIEANHANQMNELTRKNQQLAKKIQEQSNKNASHSSQQIQSLNIQISQLKVKIKHHQEIYLNLEKDYAQKEKQVTSKAQFIQKVREYVSKIQEENREKDQAIRQRDEFIAKAKEFITNKEADMLSQVQKYKKEISILKEKVESSQKLKNDFSLLANQNKEKQSFLGDIIRESNDKQLRIQQLESQIDQMHMILTQMQRKIEEMQGYIEMQNERFQTNMDEVQQLNRKIKSQQETLEDLVKKNLDMEIQLNLKNFQLKSIRGR